MRTLLFFLYFAISVHCYPQTSNYTPKVMLAIETYAFLKGQSSALKKIALQFPALKNDVAAIENNSQIIFGRSEENIEDFLKNELTISQFNTVKNGIDSLLNQQLKHPIENKKYALDFLEKVKDKMRLNEVTATTKGVISFAYHDEPHQEIIDGHIVDFSTEDHPKAKQAAIKISIPKSWSAEEAQMASTVKQFTSHDGKGDERVLILIHDLPAPDHNLVLNQNSVAEMIPPESTLIRTEPVTIDGKPGMMVETEEVFESSSNKMKIRMLQFMLAHERKLYCLQGSIGPVEISENLDLQLKKHEPLFRLIANRMQIIN